MKKLLIILPFLLISCVSTRKHNEVLDDLKNVRLQLAISKEKLAQLKSSSQHKEDIIKDIDKYQIDMQKILESSLKDIKDLRLALSALKEYVANIEKKLKLYQEEPK